ncbi:MAG TPA: hypothetical protein VGR28_06200 [Candidatus Thermoplasmatota archaeon]|nr:hypothetical protein [Candidatus Thermoplasmatota archaeon]
MEIERAISGDLNKNIEQCVSLLMDVERRLSNLKTELAQTLAQTPGARSAQSAFVNPSASPFGPVQAPLLQVIPQTAVSPHASFGTAFATPFTGQYVAQAPFGTQVPGFASSPYGQYLVQSPFGTQAPGFASSPYGQYLVQSPFGTQAPGFASNPYGAPAREQTSIVPGFGIPGAPGFAPLVQGFAPISPNQGHNYIW